MTRRGNFAAPLVWACRLSLATHAHDVSAAERASNEASADEHGMVQDWSTLIWSGSAAADQTLLCHREEQHQRASGVCAERHR